MGIKVELIESKRRANNSTVNHDFSHVDWRVASLAEVDLAALRARFDAASPAT